MTDTTDTANTAGSHRIGPLVLVCPECYETAVFKPPREWLPAWGPTPAYSHWDGEALCAVMTRDGYRSAEPKLVEMQP